MAFLLAEAYLHRLDPFIIEFPQGWPLDGLRWYGMSYLAGFAIAWLLVRRMSRSERSLIPAAEVPDIMVAVVVGVLLGGRLGYCVFYDPGLLVEFTSRFPFWGFLAINRGGMASHGGMIGVVLACLVYARRHRHSLLHMCDVGALVTPPGLFLGRLANFINGELRGTPLPADAQANPPWWSVKYPDEVLDLEPARLDGVRDGLTAALQLEPRVDPGKLLAETHEALLAGDATVTALVRPLLTAHYPSQVLQALTDGPILLALLIVVWWRPRKPGVVGSWFLIGYGVLRILTEAVREIDPHLKGWQTPLGLVSRGQLLSALMVVAGVALLAACARRDVPELGGLRPRPRPGAPPSAPPGSPGPASG